MPIFARQNPCVPAVQVNLKYPVSQAIGSSGMGKTPNMSAARGHQLIDAGTQNYEDFGAH